MIGNQTLDSAVTPSAAAALQRPATSQHKMAMAFAGHHAFPGMVLRKGCKAINFALVCLVPPK